MLQGLAAFGTGVATHGIENTITDSITRWINAKAPYQTPDINDLMDLWQQGWIDDKAFVFYTGREGWEFAAVSDIIQDFYQEDKDKKLDLNKELLNGPTTINRNFLRSRTWRPEPDRIISWLNREWITEDLANGWLRMSGIVSSRVRNLFIQQRYELPTPQDLIQFSVRHGFEPDILTTFGYAQEIPSNYLKWANRIGLGGSSDVSIANATDENGNPIPKHDATWAEQHWFAHWILPSLGDAYEMLHRLYPSSDFGPSPDWKQGLDFTPDLLSLFQRAQDIPKYWRDRLQSISFLPLSRVDVRRMFNSDVITESEVYHSYRAQGYNDTKSKQLLSYTKIAKQDAINLKTNIPKTKTLCELFSLGILTEDELRGFATTLHIPDTDIDDLIHNCNLDASKSKIKAIESAMHKGFLKGVITEDDIKSTLNDLNIREDAINNLLDQWELEQQFEFKESSASEASKWYEAGIITQEEFVGRLQNLRIDEGAILNMVSYADYNIEKRALMELEKQIKEAEAKLRQDRTLLRQQQKDQQTVEKDRIKALLASSTQVNLKAWWKDQIITEAEVRARLTALDYLPDDIDRWLISFGPKTAKPKKGQTGG